MAVRGFIYWVMASAALLVLMSCSMADRSLYLNTFAAVLPEGSSILLAVSNGANSTFGDQSNIAYPTNATGLNPFCALKVKVASSPTSSFTFALWLPRDWNQRFLAIGNDGFAGGVNYLDMGAGLGYGFAVVSSDLGHNSTMIDITWALNAPEKKIDWGYRALHGSVVLAKQLTHAYYKLPIRYSYFSGCSTGGSQGLKEIQKSPPEFDGVLAGAPAWWTQRPHHIPAELFPIIGAEVFSQCDGVDGLVDGIIENPRQCDFRPETLICKGKQTKDCLTAPQIDTLLKLHSDYVDVNQTFVFPRLELGSETQWPFFLSGSAPHPFGVQYIQNFLLDDPDWAWENFNYSIVELSNRLDPGNATPAAFDLSAFRARGGKLLQYHGLGDGLIPAGLSTIFYNQVLRTLAPEGIELDPWYRFFPVPGMLHCSESVNDAPWYFAGAKQAGALGTHYHSVPGHEDARHDVLLALMAWVEDGTAPARIVATKFRGDDPRLGVAKQTPVCPYPLQVKYIGGDVSAADSYKCA